MRTDYNIARIESDFKSQLFTVYLLGYQPIEVLFIEIESFIEEYDQELYNYLLCKHTLPEKIYEAIDIGYDFSPMIADLLKSFIEYDIITLIKM